MAEQQWMQQLAEVEDAATVEAFQQGAKTMLQDPQPQEHQAREEDEVPTEPATSPRQINPQARAWPAQLPPPQGPIHGPQDKPERYPNPYICDELWSNDSRTTSSRVA